jgi:hypothetical protein
MKHAALFSLIFLIFPAFLFSEPYIAMREGLKCSSCHENGTGGGKRTRFGAGFGAQDLPWKTVDLQGQKIPTYWSFRNDLISLGGDFRALSQTTFVKNDTANTFQTDKSNLYLSVRLLPDVIHFYLDETVAPGGAQTREIFAQLKNLPGHGWIKAGKFVLPYGLRIEDDRAFVREITGFNFTSPDLGAELGFEPGAWTIVSSISNGNAGATDNNTGKLLTGNLVYTGDRFRLGASASYNAADSGNRKTAGAWGGFQLGPAVFLGEADFIRDETDPLADHDRIVTYSEVNYAIARGWNVKAGYEYFDADRDIPENERDRFFIGVEPFLLPFVQMQVFYRFNQSIPQNSLQNADELSVRLHLYF